VNRQDGEEQKTHAEKQVSKTRRSCGLGALGGSAAVAAVAAVQGNASAPFDWTALQEIDRALDASLSATLAGLALAAATFMTVVEQSLRGGDTLGIERRLVLAQSAQRDLLVAFYCFLVALTANLSLDAARFPGGGFDIVGAADLLASGGAIAAGMAALTSGSLCLRRLTAPMERVGGGLSQ
jgi:hypothetical protein